MQLKRAVDLLEEMGFAAREYVASAPGWSSSVEYYLHAYGHTPATELQLHLVDLLATGPTFHVSNRNLPLRTALEVLREELEEAISSGDLVSPPSIHSMSSSESLLEPDSVPQSPARSAAEPPVVSLQPPSRTASEVSMAAALEAREEALPSESEDEAPQRLRSVDGSQKDDPVAKFQRRRRQYPDKECESPPPPLTHST